MSHVSWGALASSVLPAVTTLPHAKRRARSVLPTPSLRGAVLFPQRGRIVRPDGTRQKIGRGDAGHLLPSRRALVTTVVCFCVPRWSVSAWPCSTRSRAFPDSHAHRTLCAAAAAHLRAAKARLVEHPLPAFGQGSSAAVKISTVASGSWCAFLAIALGPARLHCNPFPPKFRCDVGEHD